MGASGLDRLPPPQPSISPGLLHQFWPLLIQLLRSGMAKAASPSPASRGPLREEGGFLNNGDIQALLRSRGLKVCPYLGICSEIIELFAMSATRGRKSDLQ